MKRKLKLNSNGLLLFYCLIFTTLIVTGCNKKDEAPKPPQVQAAAKPKPQLKPEAIVQKQLSSPKAIVQGKSLYSFKTKKDPFKPLITAPEPSSAKERPSKIKLLDALPIQSYEANTFVVTGIVTGLKENKALVIDQAGKGYVVKTGMLIGSSGGRITNITTSAVVVTEDIDGSKRKKTRTIVLPLSKKSKETSR